jgi:hypothetical protein
MLAYRPVTEEPRVWCRPGSSAVTHGVTISAARLKRQRRCGHGGPSRGIGSQRPSFYPPTLTKSQAIAAHHRWSDVVVLAGQPIGAPRSIMSKEMLASV